MLHNTLSLIPSVPPYGGEDKVVVALVLVSGMKLFPRRVETLQRKSVSEEKKVGQIRKSIYLKYLYFICSCLQLTETEILIYSDKQTSIQ